MKRVFISFDYDHDETLKNFLVGQARLPDSPFELADWSIKEHIDGNWKVKAETRIRSVDVVVVICGLHTDRAVGVSAEVRIAQAVGKPYFLLKGYKDVTCVAPTAASASDKIYLWTWENLKALLAGKR
jgi:hypothetical protein|tara:strand:- start:3076 stop:3459 length:384 start_codon:yes stop_codon:yes gene_type:complete